MTLCQTFILHAPELVGYSSNQWSNTMVWISVVAILFVCLSSSAVQQQEKLIATRSENASLSAPTAANSSDATVGTFFSKKRMCPTWQFYYVKNDTCLCGPSLNGIVKCNATTNETLILDCYCISYNESQGEVVGACFFGCARQMETDPVYTALPTDPSSINQLLCDPLNREGQLCASCKPGYCPLVYSYDLRCGNCTQTQYNGLKFSAVAFIPLTLFYFFVLFFKLNAANPLLNGYVIFAQVISSGIQTRLILVSVKHFKFYSIATKIVLSLYGIWNLDFFRVFNTEISLDISPLQALALDYSVAFYPLLLIAISFVFIELHARNCRLVVRIWKPFYACLVKLRNKWYIRTTILDAFATFCLLSYFKLCEVTLDLLLPTSIHDVHNNDVGQFLYYDSSLEYFGRDHLLYGIVAVIIAAVFLLFPLLLFFMFPTKCFRNWCDSRSRSYQIFAEFMNAFHGYYKDGTEPGTRDCRCFAGIFILIRFVIVLTFVITLNIYAFVLIIISLIIFSMLILVCRPYKERFAYYNTVDACMLLLLAMVYCALLSIDVAQSKFRRFISVSYYMVLIIGTLPLIYITVVALHWLYFRRKMVTTLFPIRKRLNEGYVSINGAVLPHRVSHPEAYHSS